MKQILIGLMSGVLFLSACRQVPAGDMPAGTETPVFVTQSVTSTPSPILVSTITSLPTATLTASITPLPTIYTFTPTFDASTILTVTPAPKAECPKENPAIVPDFPKCYPAGYCDVVYPDEVLNYLNLGGTLDKLAPIFSNSHADMMAAQRRSNTPKNILKS